jgi:hypothetical protein
MIHLATGLQTNESFNVHVLNDENHISDFYFEDLTSRCVIDNEAGTISVTVPYGTDITNLTPHIELPFGATCAPTEEPPDFTNTVHYTVTAEDGDSKVYAVTVNIEPHIIINIGGGMPSLSFTPASISVEGGATIALSGNPSAHWYVKIGGEPFVGIGTCTGFNITAPGSSGFYNVTVIASVGGIDYAGNFVIVVTNNED